MSDFLKGKVDVPVVGQVDKKVLAAVGGVAVVFIGWKWWQASAGGGADEYVGEDPGFEGGEVLPSVSGAVSPDNSYGLPGDDEPESLDDYGFRGTTNSQWTQYAATQLSQSERWGYTDIIVALGKYLAGAALDTTQVEIVQAAISLAGRPPVGNHPILTAPSSPVSLPAPGNLRASSITQTTLRLDWNAVAGASKYAVRRDGTEIELSGDTSMNVTGLKAGTSYAFTVAAEGLDGTEGGAASLTAKTLHAKTTLPADPPTPKPTTPKPSKPSAKRYPTRWKTVVNGPNSNYSQIAQKYKLGISGNELYQYQFSSQARRPSSTKATLKKRGANLIYAAGTTVLPYPK